MHTNATEALTSVYTDTDAVTHRTTHDHHPGSLTVKVTAASNYYASGILPFDKSPESLIHRIRKPLEKYPSLKFVKS